MSTWSAIVIVAVVGVMTYSMRAVVIVAMANRVIPTSVARALRSVGPAVLAALAVSLAVGGDGGPSLEIAEAAGLAVAGLAAWRTRNLIVTLLAGMTTLWFVTWLL
ncbi:AzlD domain-containing protein [Ilumatobacter sp.]|jgi:branched-subunit amino acid transport protein|uniref:AzlD domain-containing protein n=1 Tax=Ilumatobacter sp. TaxID=1967498 RepID=UPI003AF7190E